MGFQKALFQYIKSPANSTKFTEFIIKKHKDTKAQRSYETKTKKTAFCKSICACTQLCQKQSISILQASLPPADDLLSTALRAYLLHKAKTLKNLRHVLVYSI